MFQLLDTKNLSTEQKSQSEKIRKSELNAFAIFFVLLLIPFIAYFLRPDFVGMDSYAYLLQICNQNNAGSLNGTQYFVASLLPCDFFILKVMLFGAAFISGCFIIKLAILFNKRNGWMAAFLIFLSSTTVLEFTKLENDAFAFPILFASLYYFYKAIKTGSRWLGIVSLALLGIASLMWRGSFFYLFAYGMNISVILVPVVFLMLLPWPYNWRSVVGQILRTNFVMEDMPFLFRVHWILNLGLLGLWFEPLLMYPGLLMFLLGAASAKYWILSLPFITVGAVTLIERLNIDTVKFGAIVLSLFMVFALTQSVLVNPPQPNDWNAINFAMMFSKEVSNDWGMGYWVIWAGGDTNSFGSHHHQQVPHGITISKTEQDCDALEDFGGTYVYWC